jgi:hypothetical protein
VAWLHHSNLHASRRDRSALLRSVGPVHRLLVRAGAVEPEVHWRDPTVDADVVARLAAQHGLVCVEQELLRWGDCRRYLDVVTVLVRPGSAAPIASTGRGRWENAAFEQERAAAFEASER